MYPSYTIGGWMDGWMDGWMGAFGVCYRNKGMFVYSSILKFMTGEHQVQKMCRQ